LKLPPLTDANFAELEAGLLAVEIILASHQCYPKTMRTLETLQKLINTEQRDQRYNTDAKAAKAALAERQKADQECRVRALIAQYAGKPLPS
jgi:hypothetical protein